MSESEKIGEIVNKLEEMKKELDELKEKIKNLRYESDIEKLFTEIEKIVGDNRIKSIVYLNSNTVKYISRYQNPNAYRNVLIIGRKLYNWNDYRIEDGIMRIRYANEFEISDEVVNLLQKVPESDAEHLEPYYFNFYHLIKNGTPLNLVKE